MHVALSPIPNWEQKLGTAFHYSHSSSYVLGQKSIELVTIQILKALMFFPSQFGIQNDKIPFMDLFLSATTCCCGCNHNVQLFTYFQWSEPLVIVLISFDSHLS